MYHFQWKVYKRPSFSIKTGICMDNCKGYTTSSTIPFSGRQCKYIKTFAFTFPMLEIFVKLNSTPLKEGVNGVNRLATKGKKYYRLPTKREKNYRLPTGKILTHYRHGPTLSTYFFRKKSIFSTFLGSNQRYHVTSLFTNIPQNEGIEIGLHSI